VSELARRALHPPAIGLMLITPPVATVANARPPASPALHSPDTLLPRLSQVSRLDRIDVAER
jgi:hypothetical protein